MQRQRVLAFVLVIAGAAGPARAQSSEGLAGLLLRFFSPSNPVVLAPNLQNPALSHDAHFVSQSNAQATLRQLNAGIAAQLSTFPIGSSSGGFTFTFDESLGVYNRTTQSFGPIFAERPLTAGKGKFSLAVNYQHGTWDRIDGLRPRRRRAAALPRARGHQPRRHQPEPVLRGRHHRVATSRST